MHKQIFSPLKISSIRLKNRIIRSATHEGLADENGFPVEKLKRKYIQLAKGEAGAIITGYAGVKKDGKSSLYRMLMMDFKEKAEAFKEIINAVHEYDTPIILQLAHCGRQTRKNITGYRPVAPSAIRDKFFNEEVPDELSENDIYKIIERFVNAICFAKNTGFDGVQLHAAHGYLLAQFLSPYTNRRKDMWGGNTENRFRIIKEILNQAEEKVNNYPVLIKLNAYDGRDEGMTIEEAVKIAKLLEQNRCTAIEVSCGTVEDNFFTTRCNKIPVKAILKYTYKFKKLLFPVKAFIKLFINIAIPPVKPLKNYNVEAAKVIKENVSIPVIVVGGITSIKDIKDIILNNKADIVSMCRPFIIEPNIVKKFKEEKQAQSKCIHCNYCLIGIEERPLKCYYGKLKE